MVKQINTIQKNHYGHFCCFSNHIWCFEVSSDDIWKRVEFGSDEQQVAKSSKKLGHTCHIDHNCNQPNGCKKGHRLMLSQKMHRPWATFKKSRLLWKYCAVLYLWNYIRYLNEILHTFTPQRQAKVMWLYMK